MERNAGFLAEEMAGAKSRSEREYDCFVELLVGYSDLNRMAG